jgi:CheY-like chemotaxis protein
LERVFEPFCQASSQLWHSRGGSGLGLTISKEFVKLHGGRMWLESELGKGTKFTFELPISPPMEPIVRPGHQIRADWPWRERAFAASQVLSPKDLVKPRVVVFDENGDLCTKFASRTDDVEFINTRSLSETLNILRECPARAVVVNAASPDEVWWSLETISQEAPHTPVVGCAVPPVIERAVDAGALGYLTKPVTREQLANLILTVGGSVGHVLLVDDDPDILDLFTRMLQLSHSGLKIDTATTGEAALDMLRDTPPDLMLLDVLLSDMDGWQLLATMKSDPDIKPVTTVLVSAHDPTDHPPVSRLIAATVQQGLSINRLLRCSLETADLLTQPETGLDPTFPRTDGA